jgi:hypothetical protein
MFAPYTISAARRTASTSSDSHIGTCSRGRLGQDEAEYVKRHFEQPNELRLQSVG